MRKATLGTAFGVEYPDKETWRLDRNLVHFNCTSVGTHPAWRGVVTINGQSYGYTTETNDVIIDITDILNTLQFDTATTMTMAVEAGGGSWVASAEIVNHRGKTLASRTHGSATIIEVEDEQSMVEVYANGDDVQITNRYEEVIAEGLTPGIYQFGIDDDESVQLKHSGVSGEVWRLTDVGDTPMRIRLVRRCGDIVLHYYDTDGISRVATGKVLNSPIGVTQSEYGRRGNVLRDMPARHVDAVREEMAIGFASVEPGQYLEDIMLSSEVWVSYNVGTEVRYLDMIPTTLDITRDDEVKNYVINFKLLR